jgi:hypothetical protein
MGAYELFRAAVAREETVDEVVYIFWIGQFVFFECLLEEFP